MKILVLNRGSSSIKCSLYDFGKESDVKLLWQAHIGWKNDFSGASLKTKNHRGTELSEELKGKSSTDAVKEAVKGIYQGNTAVLDSPDQVEAIGHRIVHGGKKFRESVIINDEVKKAIKALAELAPLHNRSDLEGIELMESLFPKKPQVAVFDTAFHRTMPEAAVVYPGPYQWVKEDIQRYGFHGISFQYCSKRAAELLMKTPSKMVICHLGSGASLCAIEQGKSIDTTMGFTPLEGLMMDTRSGSVDPGIIFHLLKKKKPEELYKELNENSGLLGLSGFSSDMRDIEEQYSQNPRAKLTFDVYIHRLNSLIGSMIASLQGIEVLVFTAGIGENSPLVRKKVCDNFAFLGVKLDDKENEKKQAEDVDLSLRDSKVRVLVIHTNEALEIAKECAKKL